MTNDRDDPQPTDAPETWGDTLDRLERDVAHLKARLYALAPAFVDGAIYAGPTGRLWRCVRSGDAVDFRPLDRE